jgi:integrase
VNGHIERREGRPRIVRGKPVKPRITYTVRIFVDKAHGGPRRESGGTFALEGDATDKLVEILAAYNAGTYRKPSELTVDELAERWLREAVAIDKAGNTHRHHKSNLTHHILPAFGECVAEQVKPDQVSAWQADQLAHGKVEKRSAGQGVAMKSLMDYRGTFHAMYAWAVAVGLVAQNPVATAPAPNARRSRRHVEPPQVEHIQAFLAELRASPRLWWPTFLLAGTGCRRGEVLAFRWEDAELEHGWDEEAERERFAGRLRIHPDRGNLTGPTVAELTFGPPKTRKGARTIELAEYVAQALWHHRTEQAAAFAVAARKWSPQQLICCGGSGQPIVPDNYTHELARFRARHQLEPIHPHLLRHAMATTMLEEGVPMEAVSEYLGHAGITTTVDTYGHVRQRVLADAAARVHARWETASAGSGHQSDTDEAAVADLLAWRSRKSPA